MNLPDTRDPRFRRLGLKLGLFIGLGLVLAVGLLTGMAYRQGYFSAKTPVSFVAESGSDLRPGMAVKLSGFKIGEVRSVALNQQARVDVEMAIEDRYMQWLRRDSVATLAREGMIGDSYISLSAGSPGLPALTAEDRLRFELGRGLADIALDLRNRVVPVIDEMQRLLVYANNPDGDLRRSFAELRALTAELRESRRRLDATLASLHALGRDEAPATLARARQTLEQADRSLQQLEAAVPKLQQQAGSALQALEQSAQQAGATATRAGTLLDRTQPQLEQVLREADVLLRDSRAAVRAARTRWPFRGPEVAPVPAPAETPAAAPAP